MSLIITRGFGPESELASTPVVVSVACVTSRLVRITFIDPIVLRTGADTADAWSIQPVGHSHEINVSAVSYSGKFIDLTTNEHKDGLKYAIAVPKIGIVDADVGARYAGPFSLEYLGISEPPFIVIVKGVDQTAIDVVFSEEVITEGALVASNYTVIGPSDVKVLSVEKLNEITYRLNTTRQTRLVNYTVEVKNIYDLAGNAIVSDHA